MKLKEILDLTLESSKNTPNYNFHTSSEIISAWFPTDSSARRVANSFVEVVTKVTNSHNRIIYK